MQQGNNKKNSIEKPLSTKIMMEMEWAVQFNQPNKLLLIVTQFWKISLLSELEFTVVTLYFL